MTSLLVETGSGVSGANTYQSLASVGEYCEMMGYTSWSSLSTVAMNSAIFRGMRVIDSRPYKGNKTDSSNRTQFPRESCTDRDGVELESNIIPKGIKFGQCEASYRESISEGVLQPDEKLGSNRIKVDKTDVLETEYFEGPDRPDRITIIEDYIGEYCRSNCSISIALG